MIAGVLFDSTPVVCRLKSNVEYNDFNPGMDKRTGQFTKEREKN